MFSRRHFMKKTTGITAAMAASELAGGALGALADPLGLPVGLQLYTVGEDLQKDLEGTLHKIAAIGYREVETAGMPGGHSAAQLRKALDGAGLRCRSTHVQLAEMLQNAQQSIDDAHTLGAHTIVCATPWVADASRFKLPGPGESPIASFLALMNSLDLDDWKWNAEQFNRVGATVAKAGLQLGYHNHGFEFRSFDGKVALEEFLRLTDPQLVRWEMDCGWVANTGRDPADYLRHYPGRITLLHVKDIRAGSKPTTDFNIQSAEIGRGAIDWLRVFKAAKAAGVKAYFVEQEPPYARPPLQEIAISYDYLHNLKV